MTLQEQVLATITAHPEGLTSDQVGELIARNAGPTCTALAAKRLIHVSAYRTTPFGRVQNVYSAGRAPTKAPERPEERTVKVVTHLTPTEHQRIFQAAKAKGQHPAGFMRNAAVEAASA